MAQIRTLWQFSFRVVEMIGGANIGLTCGSIQKFVDALNSHGQRLLNKDIPVSIVFIYDHFTKI